MIFECARLIDLDESNLELVLNWRNQEHIRNVMYHDEVITLEQHQKWFNKLKQNDRTLVKVFALDDRLLGVVNFTEIDYKNEKCSWGFYIGEKGAPKGSGTILGFLALQFIFEQVQVRKVCAEIISHNEKSIYFHRKLGFQEEGILKEHVRKNDEYLDVILMALFYQQWRVKKHSIETIIKGMMV
ncbi:UDP-4-amino-4,6-dideoxy-N-acetyl-beta-L-altrosamine N-acetyltransferase [Paenibacillus alkaliterrae]|uniref:UDP-4-amino-4, 6-dideoxy-N-acetyl-beta-L-altrosamine N-acetyltransferase n=1 Tax=Paenibacillus alkaliterrae TaxID=320909 RepID=UPI001F27175A|nr:UDP-4-amino-4,6-dideoxy-N-acetyl-beta-L-altrosamine N-acetyltransferase [Paenibacillus alkaliterrae]MCF2941398.1 UDP-4-amino-4,6-dideoxy-N-acetyl-beta-L-altrosamine N-acetyltransferase [Paenibacillus alkaliterrae]